MQISDYTYDLPEDRIALYPPAERGTSKLLVLHKQTGHIEHSLYSNLDSYLKPGDLVILNNTKVIKARLIAYNANGQTRELLLLEQHKDPALYRHKVMYRGTLRVGEQLKVHDVIVTIDTILGGGIAEISSKENILDLAEHFGSVPLPPYMHREADKNDIERYQTVFAQKDGSVAAPTASLNFTDSLRNNLETKGVNIEYLTLHVGLGTFMPIRTDAIEEHVMHSEYFEIPGSTIQAIKSTKQNGGKVVAIGTTVARTLEFASDNILNPKAPTQLTGEADIFIYPSYEFKIVDCLLTNYHAPKSTVLMLAAAFAGWDNLKHAYEVALMNNYMFLSYGDSMLIIQ